VDSGNLAIRELIQAKASESKEYDLVLMDYQMPGMNGIDASRKIRESLENVESPKIIMVTSFGREDIMDQAQKINLDGFLIKPVSPSMLFDTIMEVFGKSSGMVKRTTVGEERPEGFEKILGARILLAEDNEINQQVAVETLEAEGFYVEVANDGRETLDKLDAGWDLILMDLQMPVMDGYEATDEIRKIEKYKDLSIIAMTADAMTGVREKVIDAGMNDYVTKPINPKELWGALAKWIKPGERDLPEGFSAKGEKSVEEIIIPNIEGVDTVEGLSHVGGNKKLYLNLLSKFRDDYGSAVKELKDSLEAGDKEAAVRGAHTVKGVAGNIGAKEVQKAAAVVEAALKEEGEKDEQLEKLDEVLSELIENLKKADLDSKTSSKSEVSKIEIDPKMLKELLEELKPVLEKRKPKPAKEIIEKIDEYILPEGLGIEFEKLSKFVGKYKFKDAVEILKVINEKRLG
jgi:polar amino acid transport system substrate-binding protein